MKEIMLNKSFAGSWGLDSDENIPHEIINLFKSDNGNIYLYVPPYGGFSTNEHSNIEYIILTGEWNNNTTEVLYVAQGLHLMHSGGKSATADERKDLRQDIIDNNIKYGGKYLHEIKMAEIDEEKVFYLTFRVDKLCKPCGKLFLRWDSDPTHTSNKNIITLNEDYKYQRQIGYIQEKAGSSCDYSKVKGVIEDPSYWDSAYSPKKIVVSSQTPASTFNFMNLIHKEYDETSYTNLFYEFFNDNPSLFNDFAKTVLKLPDDDNYSISKEVETTNKQGRIDLLAIGDKYVIGIENKLKSGLNGLDKHKKLSQLTTYIEFLEEKYPNKKRKYFLFEPDYNDIDIAKFDAKRGSEFVKVQYSSIYSYFKGNATKLQNGNYSRYADDFIAALYIHTRTMRDIVEQRFLYAITHS